MCDRIRKELKFDYAVSNRLSVRRGVITGKVMIRLEHGAKDRIFRQMLKKFHAKPEEAISVGDSEGDIPLAKRCGYSIAFNSTSEKLSRMADYNCRTRDFKELYKKIMAVSNVKLGRR
jgi:phosphoserine phosphatase